MGVEFPLRVLLIGNGGREHAIAWKLSQSPLVESIVAVPGNGGTATCPKTTNVTSVSAEDFPALLDLARKNNINYVVPGPEAPLVAGAIDFFENAGIPGFGPSKLAAQMEGSKTFSKDFMKKHNIPTAAYENFSDYEKAREYLDRVQHNVVIKASGLAAGKGVIIPETREEAHQALKDIMQNKEFGSAGDEVVIEEYLTGDELSILTFSDGHLIKSLPPAQDHKRIGEGDIGLNTGGMGCYAPTNIATPELVAQIDKCIIQPTIDGMRKDRMEFKGMLFTGLMITPTGPKVLEYNVRFGDPETQTVLPLLSEDTDLADVMVACTRGRLDSVPIEVTSNFSATVVVAAGGYPESYAKGDEMIVQTPPAGINIFHAGTKLADNKLQTAGGRVIAASATAAESLRAAVDKAYEGVKLIQFKDMYYRKDIAHRAFKPTADTKKALTYAEAGVSIDAGNQFVERIRNAVRSTKRAGADAEIGGFGGEVDLSKAGFSSDAPIIVGAIDGVGTKLMIAQETRDHSTVGIDLVAMNVNDLVVQGAEPVMFLDYFGCSRLDPETAAAFVEGVAAGCRDAGCALVGGETAEMPGMYRDEDYDAAGAAIGVMRSTQRLPRHDAMAPGDVLLGLASSGVHSNGFSMVRKIVSRNALSYADPAPWAPDAPSLGAALLTPTRIYVRSVLSVLPHLKGLAHITGGGLTENVPRMLPPALAARIDVSSWPLPPVFRWLATAGPVAPAELARTFNTGIGMVAVVAAADADKVADALRKAGETVSVIGALEPRGSSGEGCVLTGLESWA
ncbi:phosphoribosylamine--glycine ligase [Camillea tinctor]|nr:phosphoribosylamine--glycine ligase [Camillea tinctor]